MKEQLLKKSNLWHLAAVALFLLISCIYFYPALQGYVVEQGDVKNWVGSSQEIADYRESGEPIGWTNSMFSGMPATQIGMTYEGRAIPDFFRSLLTLGLPSPISLLFVYFISFYVLAISFRAKPLVAIVGALAFGLSSYFIIIIEAGHITKALAVGYAPLLIAGFIFAYRWKNWMLGVGLSSLFMTFQLTANHLQITYYLIFVLIALGIVELIRHLKIEKGLIRFAKISAALIVAYLVGVLVNYGNIKGTAEYTDSTTRGGTELTIRPDGSPNTDIKTSGLDREYITAWSYGRSETFTFIVPNFKGGETGRIGDNKANDNALKQADTMFRNDIKNSNQYWGDQPFTSGPVYVGVLVVLLAFLSLAYNKDRARWALFAVAVLTILLSWGKNFMGLTDLFLDVLPGYNKFRAVTIILVIAELCIPLLGVFFLQKLYQSKDEIAKNLKPFFIISGSFAAVFVGFLIAPTVFNSFLSEQELAMLANVDVSQADLYNQFFGEIENVRISIFRKDVGRSFLILILGIGLIFAYLKSALNKTVFTAIVGLLILVDLVMVDSRYLSTEKTGKRYDQWVEAYKQKYPYVAGEGEQQILAFEMEENPSLYSKLDSALNATNTDLQGKDIDAAEKLRIVSWVTYRTLNRYTNFRVLEEGNAFNSSYVSYFNKSIGGYHGAKLGRYQDLIEFHISQNNPSVLDMLNMKYKLRPKYDQNGVMNGSMLTGKNESAMGNAWLTKRVQFVQSADEEIMALYASNTYKLQTFGEHKLIVNGLIDTNGVVETADQIQLIFQGPIDSTGNRSQDTIPVEVPFQAVSAELPIAYVLTPQGLTWDYIMDVDSTKLPLVGVTPKGRAGWNPSEVTVVDQKYKTSVTQESYPAAGEIKMTSYHPDHLVYSFSSTDKELVVFSEIYYPVGWKAYIDGVETPISCVNYVLRAVEVPEGDHKIELVYKLDSYSTAKTLAWIGSILILVLLGTGIFMQTKLKDSSGEEETLV